MPLTCRVKAEEGLCPTTFVWHTQEGAVLGTRAHVAHACTRTCTHTLFNLGLYYRAQMDV